MEQRAIKSFLYHHHVYLPVMECIMFQLQGADYNQPEHGQQVCSSLYQWS